METPQLLWGLSHDEPHPAPPPDPVYVMKELAITLRADGVADADIFAWNVTGQPQNFGLA